ncbi:MAG: hypothetical protein PHE33_12720 [Bacteroidales bacterium]|nr:hypothetical protein [Bacteroidales bacterium]
MILIIGQHEDTSTDKVCAWLNYFGAKFVRTNTGTNNIDVISDIIISNDRIKVELFINDTKYNFDNFSAIWCRRGYLNFTLPNLNSFNVIENNIPYKVESHLISETNTLESFIEYLFKTKMRINTISHYNSNKLIALQTAKSVGLKIPHTLITRKSEMLQKFIHKYNSCITKNIQDNLSYHDENYTFGHGTTDVKTQNITTESFYYSLFQKKIDKKYELRVFYLLGKFYASAAIPPMDTNHTDIRTTNKSNRHTPFNLPYDIKKKLHEFMLQMDLESGSLDIIVDSDDKYWFLEVNPVGQFDFLSGKNNFYIEKEIAKALIDGEKNRFSKN